MASSTQISSSIAPSSPSRTKRTNIFKRSSGTFSASSSGFLARITGASSSTAKPTTSKADAHEPTKTPLNTEMRPNTVAVVNNSQQQVPPIAVTTLTPADQDQPASSSSETPLYRPASATPSTSSARPMQQLSKVPSNPAQPNNFSRPTASPVPWLEKEEDDGEKMSNSEMPAQRSPDPPLFITSRQSSVSEQANTNNDDHLVAQAAQMILENARKQAQAETRKKGKSAPASPKNLGRSLSPTDSRSTGDGETKAPMPTLAPNVTRSTSRSRSKSDAGTGDKLKARKSFFRTFTSRSARSREGATSTAVNTTSDTTPMDRSAAQSGATTPGGHRRRFVDTRDIDLLMRELAAEAIAEQVPQPPFARASRSGSSSPLRNKANNGAFHDPRRRSFPSILEDGPMPEGGDENISPTNSAEENFMDWENNGARTPAGSQPTSPRLPSDDPAMSTVPIEMFTGIGSSPYQVIAQITAPTTPIHADPVDLDGVFADNDSSSVDHGSVYNTSIQLGSDRNRSTPSVNSQTKMRRPVLTMTMNDPEAELQGLTRPPKASKKSTPFASRSGSRANSRAPSPRASFSNLKQEAGKLKMSAEGNKALDKLAASQKKGRQASGDSSERSEQQSDQTSRMSSMFRSGKSKQQGEANADLLTPSSPHEAARELRPGSPHSAAVSARSDNEMSPAAFRPVDLPAEEGGSTSKGAKSAKSARSSLDGRVSAGSEAEGPSSGNKKGIRKLLRRLSSFGSSGASQEGTRNNGAKVNFPDNSTMPALDRELLQKLKDDRGSPSPQPTQAEVPEAPLGNGADLALSKQIARTVPEEKDNVRDPSRQDHRNPQLHRSTSRTPSSEDSFFLSSDNSYSSGRESVGIFKQGSESAPSEELNTPEISTGYLPESRHILASKAATTSETDSTGERTPLAREH